MPAIGGKADIALISDNVPLLPKADMSGSGLPLCKLTSEPHSAEPKSLM
jgi:hypothetical protein